METKQNIKSWYELRSTKEGETKIVEFRKVAREFNLFDNENLIVWFMNRFPDHNNDYFGEWCKRYNKGTQYFLSRMDHKSTDIFKQVFLK